MVTGKPGGLIDPWCNRVNDRTEWTAGSIVNGRSVRRCNGRAVASAKGGGEDTRNASVELSLNPLPFRGCSISPRVACKAEEFPVLIVIRITLRTQIGHEFLLLSPVLYLLERDLFAVQTEPAVCEKIVDGFAYSRFYLSARPIIS